MKTIEIFGDNYLGKWNRERKGSRGIIIDGTRILLSYEKETNQYMIPGGGLEGNESEKECCIREIAEETGMVADMSECMLEINEYYEDAKFINRYFICKIIGKTEMKLTNEEYKAGMAPRWVDIKKIKNVFSEYEKYKNIDELKRGLYLREYTALSELIK